MNVEDFLKKLFGEHYHLYLKIGPRMVNMNVEIDPKQLQDNIDLLARELHMEVETMAENSKREIKEDDFYLPDDVAKDILLQYANMKTTRGKK